MSTDYASFLARKSASAPPSGIVGATVESEYLFPFQRDCVEWALRRGKAALFESVGLGKTRQQLTYAHEASLYLEDMGESSAVLILTPLAVAAQTVREAERIGIAAKYCKAPEDEEPGVITVTNYDRLERFNPKRYGVVVLDESSVIKHQGSKRRNLIIGSFHDTPFRLACTATPAPNDRKELGNHAEFLGVMTMQEMLSEFFVHDSGDTGQWRLKGHARDRFWQWVASWGAMVTKPSDLGYPDDGYDLPPLTIHDHVIGATIEQDREVHAKSKQLNLIPMPATNLKSQRKARRVTLEERVRYAVEIVGAEPHEQWLIWCELNDESEALIEAVAKAIPGAVEIRGSHSAEKKEAAMLGFASGSIAAMVTKSSIAGFGMNFQSCARSLFVGVTHKYEEVHQALGRNHRFGQTRPVHAHMVYSELEGNVRENLRRKAREYHEMADAMRGIVAAHVKQNVRGLARDVAPYHPTVDMRIADWLVSEAS